MKLGLIRKWSFLTIVLMTALIGAVFSFADMFQDSVKSCNEVYSYVKKVKVKINVPMNHFNKSTYDRYNILAVDQPFSKYSGDEKIVEGIKEHRYLGNSAYINGQKLYNPYYPDDEIVTKPLHQWEWKENEIGTLKIDRFFQDSEELKLKYEAGITIALMDRFGDLFDESEKNNSIEHYFKRATVLQPMTEHSRGFIQFRHIKEDGSSWYITIVTPKGSDDRVINYIRTKEDDSSSVSDNDGTDSKVTDGDDLVVAEVKALRYPANSDVKGYVTVENKTSEFVTTKVNFEVEGITTQEVDVTLSPEELKMIEFPFRTKGQGTLEMSGEINKSHDISEVDYTNNKRIESIEIYDVGYVSGGCSNGSNKVKWTETDSRLEERTGYKRVKKTNSDGTVSYRRKRYTYYVRVYYDFTYEAVISVNVKVYDDTGKKASKGNEVGQTIKTKSGYGFFVEPVASVSYKQISGEWNRSPDNKPSAPDRAVMKMSWSIPNKDYRGEKQVAQNKTLAFERLSTNGSTSSFILPSNPISKKYGYRKAYTFLDLEDGSHDYYVTVYANAPYKTICDTWKGSVKISGTMHDDYRIN